MEKPDDMLGFTHRSLIRAKAEHFSRVLSPMLEGSSDCFDIHTKPGGNTCLLLSPPTRKKGTGWVSLKPG